MDGRNSPRTKRSATFSMHCCDGEKVDRDGPSHVENQNAGGSVLSQVALGGEMEKWEAV
jgi:hypothetical protein